ncbi:hypothetical protein OG259_08005 [Streptomyces sp. NBC_00250]|uniref:hypothetical protein n=1 Tax=Streptomyces sp. NBC_00250 TaxID=2903641 RepID=UPI002E2D07AD|nr:hypothetical protein [Streptomyces sp. NBC_00250]
MSPYAPARRATSGTVPASLPSAAPAAALPTPTMASRPAPALPATTRTEAA